MSTPDSTRTYSGQFVSERRADRRARFVEAALTVFTEKSYVKSSITDLCAAAGLSRRQFYEEYTGREELLVAAYDLVHRDARIAVDAAMAAIVSNDKRELVVAAVTAYFNAMVTDIRRAKLAFVEIVGVSAAVEAHRAQMREAWAPVIESVAAVSGVPAPPEGWRTSVTAYMAAVNGLAYRWSQDDPRRPTGEAVDVLATMMLALMDRASTLS